MTTKPEGRPPFPWQHIPAPGKIYGTATVGERGQVAIPAEARKQLSIKSGDKLVVFGNKINGSLILVRADVLENFAEFFLTKLNKLGEHAEAFFAQFTDPAEQADAAGEEALPLDDAAAPAPSPTAPPPPGPEAEPPKPASDQ
ncbi:MAG: AbrB/MazE/SpoVT family DNA-binding domain-containing protein [Bifidobacteriaceae bacterium]|jgi:AbrB family looped-hinge helix DNA binding protein|nr:AbrB/MazE/SpoVT family DNA-binding domain-containing protein [Bifidobacteriaceae bacterium]